MMSVVALSAGKPSLESVEGQDRPEAASRPQEPNHRQSIQTSTNKTGAGFMDTTIESLCQNICRMAVEATEGLVGQMLPHVNYSRS